MAFGSLFGYFVYYNVSVPLVPVSAQVLPSLILLSWLTTLALLPAMIARAVRQIALIRRLFSDWEVDLFDPRPIYTISRYASLIGIILLIIMYGLSSIAFPSIFFTPVGIFL